ncbi:unnamed protein product [Calicophoron daubneyi]|uniref:Uncharacterized protein n=1 Tax=Calicophoron daubneyi TaxID=300641 RepID=A0AAV2SYN4_CALDB
MFASNSILFSCVVVFVALLTELQPCKAGSLRKLFPSSGMLQEEMFYSNRVDQVVDECIRRLAPQMADQIRSSLESKPPKRLNVIQSTVLLESCLYDEMQRVGGV